LAWTKESVANLLWVNNKLKEAFAKAKTEKENQYRQIEQRMSANNPFLTSYNLDAKIIGVTVCTNSIRTAVL
jgi:hypothetical protein